MTLSVLKLRQPASSIDHALNVEKSIVFVVWFMVTSVAGRYLSDRVTTILRNVPSFLVNSTDTLSNTDNRFARSKYLFCVG